MSLEFKEWEKNTPYFNGCLPIEVMAEKGVDTFENHSILVYRIQPKKSVSFF